MSDLHQHLLRATRPLVGGGHLGVKVNRARAALRSVVELHPPVSFGQRLWCERCARPHPCETVQAIASNLGVEP